MVYLTNFEKGVLVEGLRDFLESSELLSMFTDPAEGLIEDRTYFGVCESIQKLVRLGLVEVGSLKSENWQQVYTPWSEDVEESAEWVRHRYEGMRSDADDRIFHWLFWVRLTEKGRKLAERFASVDTAAERTGEV